VWTAKRVSILVIGLVVCLGSYSIYTLFLGVIDGLPPLEISKLPVKGPIIDVDPWKPNQGDADHNLAQGFGQGCPELQRPLRLWLPDKGIAFAAGEFNIDRDGRVRLAPFSAALYHKTKVPGGYPEISTIRCDVAILTLDRPVMSYSELNNRKVIAVEMVGRQPGIQLTSNRRTPQKNDDVDILITNGNLFYEESRDLIYTDGVVCLTDNQAKPPTVIRGKGLDMFLAKDSGPNRQKTVKPRPADPQSDTGNIERLHLRSDVEMHFWVDANSGFLGGTPNTKKPAQPAADALDADNQKPAEKAHIHIHTGGPFTYDLTRETAWFESPPARASKAAKGDTDQAFAGDQVHVERFQKVNRKEKFDQLTCDRLDLQFRRKIVPGGVSSDGAVSDKEIETATATRRDINEVTLSLDTEGMAAFGSKMFYRAGDSVNGPLTILYGESQRPLRTVRDGHSMKCLELHLFAANRFGEGQRAYAKGPGQIDLLDKKNPDKETFPTHIIWRDTLTVVKTQEGGQVFDLMTVVGEASFIDDVQKQELHGEKIMVWLENKEESARKPDASGGSKQELHRVLAQDRVRAVSPEYIVRRSNRLTIMFLAAVGHNDHLPDLPLVANKPAEQPNAPPIRRDDKSPLPPSPLVENKTPSETKKPSPPIELEGNEITVAVSTLGTKKELQELIAKGNVYVFQAGETPGIKSLDIHGTLLTVKYAEKGHTLVVYGAKDKPARVEVGESIVWGPVVTVNQADNRAEVEGNGAMEMPSNKSIDGTQTSKKNSRITIHWNKNMTFDGKYAMFHGGVQAHENGSYSKVQCQVMTAILDKTVSFKDGQKDKQDAKIDRLVFDKNVYIDDTQVDNNNQFKQRNVILGQELINRDDGHAHVVGPGEVRFLSESADQGFGPPSPAAAPNSTNPERQRGDSKMEWKLTHVKFRDSMDSNTKGENKKAIFYGLNEGVEVFHFLTTLINDRMDPDHPPKNALYLRCEILTVEGKQIGDRTAQTMIAQRNVTFKTDQYMGRADTVKYDESTDIVIFEGNVNLYQLLPNGQAKETAVNARKVLYNRKTGKTNIVGVTSIRSN
jgi:lipopolysaccharide export system protein LptA